MKHLLSLIVLVGTFFAISAALLSTATVRAGGISQPTVDAWGTFSQIVAGNWHTCALNTTGDVYCWGNHYYGTAGVGDFNILISGQKYDSPQAASMPSGITFSSITGGANHNCGLTTGGDAYCWGQNVGENTPASVGRLGIDPTDYSTGDFFKAVGVPNIVLMPTGVTFQSIDAGGSTTCALTAAGDAYCWGDNFSGQIGNGTRDCNSWTGCMGSNVYYNPAPGAVTMPAGVTFTAITTGGSANSRDGYTCALGSDNGTYCWGDIIRQYDAGLDLWYTVTDGSNWVPTSITLPAGVTFSKIAGGSGFVCALTASGDAYCWGKNNYGQLGDGTTTDNYEPVAVSMPAGVTFTDIATCCSGADGEPASGSSTINGWSGGHVCALTSSGTVYCWGKNEYGQLGNGASGFSADSNIPVAVTMPAGVTFTSITVGGAHSCALTAGGSAYCWGNNSNGQSGHHHSCDSMWGAYTTPLIINTNCMPTATPSKTRTATRTATATNTPTSTQTNTLTPSNTSTHTATSTSTNTRTATSVATATRTATSTSTRTATNVVTATRSATSTRTATATRSATGVVQTRTPSRTEITSDKPGEFSISLPPNNAINQSSTVTLSWEESSGATNYGYCIDTNSESCDEWVNVGNKLNTTVRDLEPATTYYWKVRASNGSGTTVANNNSTLKFTTGKNSSTSTITATRTLTPTPHPYAIKDVDVGASFTLAVLNNGTLVTWGINKQAESTLPRWLSSKLMDQVATGANWSLALGTNGRVYGWGKNDFTQLNIPDSVSSNVVEISAGLGHALALKSNGEVVAWGRNDFKQIDIPSKALKGVTAIAAGHSHSLAVKGGKVIAWGRKTFGQTDVPVSLSNVVRVAAGFDHSLALKSNGTVICWGSNAERQCAVPTTLKDVIDISAGVGYSMALTRDGTVYAWGRNTNRQAEVPKNLGKASAIAAGYVNSVIGLRDSRAVAFGDARHDALVSRTPTVTP